MAKYFECKLNKSALRYNCGETICFEVYAKDHCNTVYCECVHWELQGDDGKILKGIGSCDISNPLVLKTTLDRPGFVHLICKAYTRDGILDDSFEVLDAGAGAEVEKIGYSDVVPSDFCEYWGKIEKMIDDFPVQLMYNKEIEAKQGFIAYDIRIKTPEGRNASGILTMPQNEGSFPLRVSFRGYSVVGAVAEFCEDTICACFNAHGIENDISQTEIEQKYSAELDGYGFKDDENQSNMTTYWRGVMIRNLIGVKYLKTLDNWDGKTLIITGGSQGAFQATTVAAHTKGVTYLEIGVPWFCNLKGENNGYLAGWRPKFREGLRYFDTVAQGQFVKCPVKITAGLGDYICPPSSVMALYNGIKTLKTITFTQAATHGYAPYYRETYTLNFDPENPKAEFKKGIYRHFKGREYEVLDIALDCETLEEKVVYRALYGEQKLWVRPKDEFCDFVFRDNKPQRRFKFIK